MSENQTITRANDAELEFVADACFDFLVSDPEELARFMNIVGYDPQSLKKAIGSRTLALGMIEYFANYEPSLLAMCANAQLPAERFHRVWQHLNSQSD